MHSEKRMRFLYIILSNYHSIFNVKNYNENPFFSSDGSLSVTYISEPKRFFSEFCREYEIESIFEVHTDKNYRSYKPEEMKQRSYTNRRIIERRNEVVKLIEKYFRLYENPEREDSEFILLDEKFRSFECFKSF